MSNQRGYSALETALVLPILLGLAFASIDLSNAFRSYTALQEGVRTATRCAYTTDGSCVSSNASSPSPIYDVTLHTGTPTPYGFMYLYTGKEEFITKPTYVVDNFHAEVLGEVQYNANEFQHFAHMPMYEIQGTPKINLIHAVYPYISGSTPGGATFSFFNQHGKVFQPNDTISLSQSRTVNASQPIKSFQPITFNMPIPFDITQACKKSTQFNYSDDPTIIHTADTPNCVDMTAVNATTTNIVLWVKGNNQGSSNGATGTIRLSLDGVPLGGRQFTSSPGLHDASLVPRGAPKSFSDTAYHEHYKELYIHSPLTIQNGQSHTISLSLEYDGGAPGDQIVWNGDEIQIFFAKVTQGEDPNTWHDCAERVPLSQLSNPQTCTLATTLAPGGAVSLQAKPNSVPEYQNPTPIGTSYNSGLAKTQELLQTANLGPDYVAKSPAELTGNSAFLTNPCPQIGEGGNFGVPEPAVNHMIQNSPTAMQVCAPDASSVFNVEWTEVSSLIPGNPSATWIRKDCNENEIPVSKIPTVVNLYHKPNLTQLNHSYLGQATAREEWISTGPIVSPQSDPNYVVATNPLYSCTNLTGGFQADSFEYNENLPGLPSESLFNGYQYELDCEWEQTIKAEAQLLENMDPSAYFVANKGGPSIQVPLPGQPTSSCITFWSGSINPTNMTSQYIGQYEKNNFPAECFELNQSCSYSLVGFLGGDPSASGYQVNFTEAAETFGFSEIQAIHPQAKWQCGDPNCYELTLSQNGKDIIAEGSVKVKMMLLGGKTVTFTYADRETVEAELSTG